VHKTLKLRARFIERAGNRRAEPPRLRPVGGRGGKRARRENGRAHKPHGPRMTEELSGSTPARARRSPVRAKLKVLALFDATSPTTIDQDLTAELATEDWKTEAHVLEALGTLGFTTEHLAIFDNLEALQRKLASFTPDVVFNLADQFNNNRGFDQHIVSYLALHGVPFTGCGPTGLTLCKHKGVSKKILRYHRIHTPDFAIIARGQRIARPRRLAFPILVKPLKEEASLGISQASFVETDAQFNERVAFIHEKLDNDVIAEEYISGRELYVSVLGNQRLTVFPIRELIFRDVPPDEPKIATYKAKWDESYRKRWGLQNGFAEGLDRSVIARIEQTARRIYRLLTIDGYARIDLRLTEKNEVYFIEANPNPMLAADEDFAQSALRADLEFPELVERIIRLGLKATRD
jgi:D-alanine-D-alanine ligase